MKYAQRILLLAVDTFIVLGSVLVSYLLRFEGHIPEPFWNSMPYAIGLILLVTCGVFYVSHLYRCVWKYASIGELLLIIRATTLALVLTFALYFTARALGVGIVIPLSIFLLSWMTTTVGIAGSRLIWRIARGRYVKIQPHHKKALIVGAGDAGTLVAKELQRFPDTTLYPVAFIDDDPSKLYMEVAGLPVVGTRRDIPAVVKRLGIDTIILALPSAAKSETAKVINICKKTAANIKILPRVSDVIHGKVSISTIRDVNVEDLLGRDPVEVDLKGIADYVTGKVVLVTGAGGSIGSELCRQISAFDPETLLLLGHGENSIYAIENELKRKYPNLKYETIIADIQDRQRIVEVFDRYRPAVVFHAAAHKHVPLMERNPAEAIKNNVIGTKNVAQCANLFGVERFVLISTDKAVNPTSVMGTTKRIAEMIIQSLNRRSSTKFVAVRFGNVLGSRGSVIPLFKQQIKEGGPVTVTHPEMVRYFMTIPEAVQLVIQAGAIAEGGETFVLDMGEPVKIDKLARDLIRLSGLEPERDIKIEYTGMRPGEKLYEELLTAEEGTTATAHNRIFIGRATPFSVPEFMAKLEKLEQAASNNYMPVAPEEMKAMLKEIVPTYQLPAADIAEAKSKQKAAETIVKRLKLEVALGAEK
ncbi:nucleoside-diphosphate sugar epimerase/dehydratase [Aneurinibacillus thermoaerophilus]|uniref:NDP-sugar epimerase, includes UDP-GlcNAc-inverting 4,6-dehydratase FlaA1 and capsular polysaccharide biosynthesis protein EpsC n=1 Tax=Aneurinibacillus thermoaerophilus TaxID=143495 RepID=A0A1G7ZYS5_ANETH|nr:MULTISPECIES: nucleoside-diphosphate sugar epimerase/dehydratase [Aneurinibacillus]AMA71677.1 polysaccharide biosynthesis protein [Aneurinibacillus sp. XH2]MED0757663.1 nucleoside-diphosphate sugar epimerase/dehydratase [Aneurinibacillus thermoaerophilus]MED0759302.1 nucleoside-diphosphate sugar epimerase/dehydratase [Aneurinibacillus thermoaerophilus]SDH13771.1 NDP-sugar epimerase, includes UDP-GlcNAc-inverting 4,6-dehydratase FlaA1 and capsular polysaccharide biosynthesis protein EpsC [Ane